MLKTNDDFKNTAGGMTEQGNAIVERLKKHLSCAYSNDVQERVVVGKTRSPTGFVELLMKAETLAQLPAPPANDPLGGPAV